MAKRKIPRGGNYDLTVSYDENGAAATIVGDTLYLTTKAVPYDSDATDTTAVIKKTVTVPNTADAIAGNYTFNLTYTDTWQEPGTYYTDVWIKRVSTGKRYPLASETWIITGYPTNRNT